MKANGCVFKYGDNVDTDVIIPARYLNSSDPAELAKHCMEDYDPDLIKRMDPGDVLVAGVGFGCGSSREHAPKSVKAAGFSCVVAKGFSRIFYRNAINIGLPIVICTEAVDDCQELDELAIDFDKGILMNVTRNKTYEITPFPAFINDIMNCGGLINRIKRNLFS